jgi:hypothetical protein
MILHPCLRCPWKENCSKKKKILEKIRGSGLNLTTASFPCKERTAHIQPGTRVEVTLRVYPEPHPLDPIEWAIVPYEDTWTGTVMKAKGHGKIAVWLDEETNLGNIRVRVWPDQVKPLFSKKVPVCPECGKPKGKANDEKWFCFVCEQELQAVIARLEGKKVVFTDKDDKDVESYIRDYLQ